MFLHNSRSLALFNSSAADFFLCHIVKPSNIFSLCLPLSLLPSIFPVVIKCSSLPLLHTCPTNLDCLFLTFVIILPFSSASFNTSSLVFLKTLDHVFLVLFIMIVHNNLNTLKIFFYKNELATCRLHCISKTRCNI